MIQTGLAIFLILLMYGLGIYFGTIVQREIDKDKEIDNRLSKLEARK